MRKKSLLSTAINAVMKPFQKPNASDLSEAQAHHSLTGVRKPFADESAVAGLTPSKLAQILRNANQGNAHDYFILAEEMEEREPQYQSVLSTRKLAQRPLRPIVEAASDDAKDKEIAAAVLEDIIKPAIFADLKVGLLDSLAKGYSVMEVFWDTSGERWKPNKYKHCPPQWFKPDKETGETLRLIEDGNEDGVELKPNKYVIHEPKLKMGLSLRGGLARLVAWVFMYKNYSVKDWASFIETYAQPLRIGRYGKAATEKDINELYRAVANIGTDCAAVLPEAMRIEFEQAANAASNGDLYLKNIQYLDGLISKAVLGQTMTTDNGSSNSQAQVHNQVREDIRDADAEDLARTIREQVIAPYVYFNYGPDARVPEFRLVVINPEDLKAFSDALIPFIDRGLKVKTTQVLEKFDLEIADKNDEILLPISATSIPLAQNRFMRAVNSTEPTNGIIDEMLGGLESDWQEITAPMILPILGIAMKCNSFEEFKDELAKISQELDASKLANALALNCFKSRGLGDASDEI